MIPEISAYSSSLESHALLLLHYDTESQIFQGLQRKYVNSMSQYCSILSGFLLKNLVLAELSYWFRHITTKSFKSA